MDRVTWHCWKHDPVHTEGEQTTDGIHFRPFLSSIFTFREKHFCSTHLKRGFWGKSKFQWINGTAPERSALIPCRRAPAMRKERSVCCVLLLYFFCYPVIIPDCTCAWFLLLANFPTLFRCFISLHLKVSPKSGQAHSPNQLIMAECHIQHSKLWDFWKWIQTFWWRKHL